MKTKLAIMIAVSLMSINGAFACIHSVLVACDTTVPAEPDPYCTGGFCTNCKTTDGNFLQTVLDESPGYASRTDYAAWCNKVTTCLDCKNETITFPQGYQPANAYYASGNSCN